MGRAEAERVGVTGSAVLQRKESAVTSSAGEIDFAALAIAFF